MDLDTKFDILLAEMKNICNKIDDKFEKIDERFEQIDKRFEQIDERFEQIDKRFEQIDERFEQIDERFEQIDERFEQVDNRINNLAEEIGAINRTLFKLDVETQNNLRILSDAVKLHNDKQLLFEEQLYRLNDKVNNPTFKVSV